MLETARSASFEPGRNLKGSVAGAAWTLLLPKVQIGHVVCLGRPSHASLATVAQAAETVTIYVPSGGWRTVTGLLQAGSPLAANVEVQEWPSATSQAPAGRSLGLIWLTANASRQAAGDGALAGLLRSLDRGGAVYAEGGLAFRSSRRAWRPPLDGVGRWCPLRVSSLFGEIRSAIPVDDRATNRYFAGRRLEGEWLRGVLAGRHVPYAQRLARLLTAAGVAGRLVHRLSALAIAGDEDPCRPPRYVRETARVAGLDLNDHRWGLSAPGEYPTKKALLYLFEGRSDRPGLLVKTTLEHASAGRLDNARQRLRDLETLVPGANYRYPEIVFDGRPDDRLIVAERVLGGDPFVSRSSGTPDCRYANDAVRWLTDLGAATAQPTEAAALAAALRELLERFRAIYQPRDEVVAALRGELDRLAAVGAQVALVFQHGDPGVQNLLIGPDGQVAFLDWENADGRGAPLWDILVFLRAYAVWSSRRSGLATRLNSAVAHFVDGSALSPLIVRSIDRYRAAVGLPREAVEPLFYFAWVYQALKEAPRLRPDGLGEGHFVRLLGRFLERRSAPLLRRIVAAEAL